MGELSKKRIEWFKPEYRPFLKCPVCGKYPNPYKTVGKQHYCIDCKVAV